MCVLPRPTHVIARPWLLGALLMLAFAAAPASAQWVWKDKEGRVTASDRPPPRDIAEKDILNRPNVDARRAPVAAAPASAASGPAAAPTALEREVQARKKAAEAEQAGKARADEEKAAAQRAENCRLARGAVAALESGVRIGRTNDKGEREVLEDTQRADELRRSREVVARDCR